MLCAVVVLCAVLCCVLCVVDLTDWLKGVDRTGERGNADDTEWTAECQGQACPRCGTAHLRGNGGCSLSPNLDSRANIPR